jgi:hypothetical protein
MKDITHEASRENRPPLSSGLRAWVRIFEAGTSSARLCRRLAHPALSLLLLGLIACRQDLSPTADNNIHFGVSAPLTGDNAQYARLWRQGFDLALEDIKDQGGCAWPPSGIGLGRQRVRSKATGQYRAAVRR